MAISTVQTAQAQDACQTLSQMIESVSLVRQIQTDPGGPTSRNQMGRLTELSSNLSLPSLIPVEPDAMRGTERDALIRYVSGLREASSGAAQGHDAYARQALSTIVSSDVFDGLSSLDTYWNCSHEPTQQALDSPAATSDRSTDTPAFKSAETGDGLNQQSQASNPAQSSGQSQNKPTTSGNGNGAYFGRDAIVNGNMMTFFFMMLIMTLVGVFFYAQRRLSRKTVREKRRVLDIPVRIKVDGQSQNVRLVDISMNGFKVHHTDQINSEDDIDVRLGGSWHTGQVRWFNPHFAGVKFRRALDPSVLEKLVG